MIRGLVKSVRIRHARGMDRSRAMRCLQRARLVVTVLVVAAGVGGCKTTPVDRSLDIPAWCEPHGCPKGGGGL